MLLDCAVSCLCTAEQPDTVWSQWVTAPCLCLGCSYIHGYFGIQGHHSAELGTLSHIPRTAASSPLPGARASLNSVFLGLVKIAPGCTKCPWHSQNWKLLGWSELHLCQRAIHTQIALCGQERKTVQVCSGENSRAFHANNSLSLCLKKILSLLATAWKLEGAIAEP